jgi:hypothetical protein
LLVLPAIDAVDIDLIGGDGLDGQTLDRHLDTRCRTRSWNGCRPSLMARA